MPRHPTILPPIVECQGIVGAGRPGRRTRLTTCRAAQRTDVLLEPDLFYGMKSVVLPAVDLLPASSIAITVMTLSPRTP